MSSAYLEYDQELQFMNGIDIADIGQFALEANNEEGFFWYLVVRTSLGITSLAECGPVIPDVELLPNNFKQGLTKMPFKEDKLIKAISFFLNDKSKKIIKAKEIEINDALNQFRDLKSYLENYGNEVF